MIHDCHLYRFVGKGFERANYNTEMDLMQFIVMKSHYKISNVCGFFGEVEVEPRSQNREARNTQGYI